jgi:hypothetical protein
MEEISRFDRQVKQGKIWDADCTCPYSPYGHVEGRTILLTWQFDDVAIGGWLFIDESCDDTCHIGKRIKRTRGPTHGCHVSLLVGSLFGLC